MMKGSIRLDGLTGDGCKLPFQRQARTALSDYVMMRDWIKPTQHYPEHRRL